MRELGINVKETAIMSAVIPFVAIIMPPVAGMLADKIGNFRVSIIHYVSYSYNNHKLILLFNIRNIITYMIYKLHTIIKINHNIQHKS